MLRALRVYGRDMEMCNIRSDSSLIVRESMQCNRQKMDQGQNMLSTVLCDSATRVQAVQLFVHSGFQGAIIDFCRESEVCGGL